jgi:hypothetical protein
MVIEFSGDESGYRNWVHANQSGFVVNQRWDGKHLVLHQSSCTWVNRPEKHTNPDAQSTKICALDRALLVQEIEKKYGRKPETCKVCRP